MPQTTLPILTVTSGLTGLGTTTVATNLAVVLARLGRRVLILDLAGAPSTVAQRLGVIPTGAHGGGLTAGPHGLRIMAAPPRATGLIKALRLVASVADFVVIDLPAGHPSRDAVSLASQRVLVVTSPEATATPQAHRLIQHLYRLDTPPAVGVLVNGVAHPDDADRAYRATCAAAVSQPGRPLEAYGLVTADPEVRRAQMMQRAVVDCRPGSPSSHCFETLGRRIAEEGPSGGGGLACFPPSWTLAHPRVHAEVRQCA